MKIKMKGEVANELDSESEGKGKIEHYRYLERSSKDLFQGPALSW